MISVFILAGAESPTNVMVPENKEDMHIDVLPRTPWDRASFNFIAAVTICSDSRPALLGPGVPTPHVVGGTLTLIQNGSVATDGVSFMRVDGLKVKGADTS